MTDHLSLALKSLKDLKSNPIIFLPSLLSGVIMFLLYSFFFVLMVFVGVFTFFEDFSSGDFNMHNVQAFVFYSVIFGLPLIIITLLVSAFFQAAQYGLMNDVSVTGRSTFDRMMLHGKTYFRKMLSYVLVKLSIILLSLFAFFLIVWLIISISGGVFALLMSTLLFTIWLLLFVAFSVMNIFNAPY